MKKVILLVAVLLVSSVPALAQTVEEPPLVNGVPAPKVAPGIDEVSTPGPVYVRPPQGPQPQESGGVNSDRNKAKELPKTGGSGSASLLTLGAGSLLVGGGLLVHRIV